MAKAVKTYYKTSTGQKVPSNVALARARTTGESGAQAAEAIASSSTPKTSAGGPAPSPTPAPTQLRTVKSSTGVSRTEAFYKTSTGVKVPARTALAAAAPGESGARAAERIGSRVSTPSLGAGPAPSQTPMAARTSSQAQIDKILSPGTYMTGKSPPHYDFALEHGLNQGVKVYSDKVMAYDSRVEQFEASVRAYQKNPTPSRFQELSKRQESLETEKRDLDAWQGTINKQVDFYNTRQEKLQTSMSELSERKKQLSGMTELEKYKSGALNKELESAHGRMEVTARIFSEEAHKYAKQSTEFLFGGIERIAPEPVKSVVKWGKERVITPVAGAVLAAPITGLAWAGTVGREMLVSSTRKTPFGKGDPLIQSPTLAKTISDIPKGIVAHPLEAGASLVLLGGAGRAVAGPLSKLAKPVVRRGVKVKSFAKADIVRAADVPGGRLGFGQVEAVSEARGLLGTQARSAARGTYDVHALESPLKTRGGLKVDARVSVQGDILTVAGRKAVLETFAQKSLVARSPKLTLGKKAMYYPETISRAGFERGFPKQKVAFTKIVAESPEGAFDISASRGFQGRGQVSQSVGYQVPVFEDVSGVVKTKVFGTKGVTRSIGVGVKKGAQITQTRGLVRVRDLTGLPPEEIGLGTPKTPKLTRPPSRAMPGGDVVESGGGMVSRVKTARAKSVDTRAGAVAGQSAIEATARSLTPKIESIVKLESKTVGTAAARGATVPVLGSAIARPMLKQMTQPALIQRTGLRVVELQRPGRVPVTVDFMRSESMVRTGQVSRTARAPTVSDLTRQGQRTSSVQLLQEVTKAPELVRPALMRQPPSAPTGFGPARPVPIIPFPLVVNLPSGGAGGFGRFGKGGARRTAYRPSLLARLTGLSAPVGKPSKKGKVPAGTINLKAVFSGIGIRPIPIFPKKGKGKKR